MRAVSRLAPTKENAVETTASMHIFVTHVKGPVDGCAGARLRRVLAFA
jgi:hypothetical protein